jgi:hypothetical protein
MHFEFVLGALLYFVFLLVVAFALLSAGGFVLGYFFHKGWDRGAIS